METLITSPLNKLNFLVRITKEFLQRPHRPMQVSVLLNGMNTLSPHKIKVCYAPIKTQEQIFTNKSVHVHF